MVQNYRRFKCESCGNIFISRAKDGSNLRCRNGEKKGCGSTLVNFIENVELKKSNKSIIEEKKEESFLDDLEETEDLEEIDNNEVNDKEEINYQCNACKYNKIKYGTKYCPNCGETLLWDEVKEENESFFSWL